MTLEQWKTYFQDWQRDNWRLWELNSTGRLRMFIVQPSGSAHLCCPITAPFRCPTGHICECAEELGFGISMIITIIRASDNWSDHCPKLRKWLLETCGVKDIA